MPIQVDVTAEELDTPVDGGVLAMLEGAVRAAAVAGDVDEAEFSLTLLDDVAIAQLNQRFLAHEGPTDVISFGLFEGGEAPVGDIYIGYEQALRQAAENGVPVDEELARLAVHGTLHVLGYEHPDGDDRVDTEMWRLQERIVSALFA